MEKQNAKRWGLVTFCVGITCGTLGAALPLPFFAPVAILVAAMLGALIGSTSVEMDQ